MFIPTMILENRKLYVVVREHTNIGRETLHLFRTVAEAREVFPGVSNRVTTSTRTKGDRHEIAL